MLEYVWGAADDLLAEKSGGGREGEEGEKES